MKIPVRQTCNLCNSICTIEFLADNKIWLQVMPKKETVSCINCFIKRADERLIDWSKNLKMYPMSFVEQIEIQKQVAKGVYNTRQLFDRPPG